VKHLKRRRGEASRVESTQLKSTVGAVGCMSLSRPRTCCIVGLFPGDSAVHKYPTRRLSTISPTESSPPTRSLGSRASEPSPSLTSLRTQTTVSADPTLPVSSSISTTPKQYTSVSVLQFSMSESRIPIFRNPKSAIRGSKFSESKTLEATRWPWTTGLDPALWWRYASPRATPTAIRWRVSQSNFSGEERWDPVEFWISHMSPLQSSTFGSPVGSSWSHRCKSPLDMNSYNTSFSFPRKPKKNKRYLIRILIFIEFISDRPNVRNL
jgi:hypothetical protein